MGTKEINLNYKTTPFKRPPYNMKKVRNVYQERTFYLFLTIVLIICLFQLVRGIYVNVAKYISLKHQLTKLEHINVSAQQKNYELKEQLENYSSSKGIEALARDNFKMVGKNEVLVVIKDSPNRSKSVKKTHHFPF